MTAASYSSYPLFSLHRTCTVLVLFCSRKDIPYNLLLTKSLRNTAATNLHWSSSQVPSTSVDSDVRPLTMWLMVKHVAHSLSCLPSSKPRTKARVSFSAPSSRVYARCQRRGKIAGHNRVASHCLATSSSSSSQIGLCVSALVSLDSRE